MMEYKGYIAGIEYDYSVDSLHGYVVNSGPYSIANFYGNDVTELKREFAVSIDEYLASCEEDGVEPVTPSSGNLMLHLGPDLHHRAALAAVEAGVSLNTWIRQAVEDAAKADITDQGRRRAPAQA